MTSGNKPKIVYGSGNVNLSVFENTSESGDVWNTYTLQRWYTTGEGEAKKTEYTNSFGIRDLPDIIVVVSKSLGTRVRVFEN